MTTYRWKHVKTEPGTGGFEGCEITTIDVTRVWGWQDWLETVAFIAGLICWTIINHTFGGCLIGIVALTFIVGILDAKTQKEDALSQNIQMWMSRVCTLCEVIAFLGIVVLPFWYLARH